MPQNVMLSNAHYKSLLSELIVALVRKHGELTVGAVTELANGLIVRHGILDAKKFV